jgi:3-phenylpropionate/cinnamic acid dioxygenase small subunit
MSGNEGAAPKSTVTPLLDEISQYIFREAALLDDRRYHEWLALLAEDIVYWVPNSDEESPREDAGVIVYERLPGLRARVARSLDSRSPTQLPPARTRHFITNVIVAPESDAVVEVQANLLLFVAKDGLNLQYPGKVVYRLRRADAIWYICGKKTYFITNNQPLRPLPLL